MRMAATLILGGLLDIFAAPVTVPLWQALIHEPIVATQDYGMQSVNLTLFLFDAVGAAIIVVGIGPAVVSICLHKLFGPPRNQF